MKIDPFYFPSKGFLFLEFTEEELNPVKNEIEAIKNKKIIAEKNNRNLVGHLKEEYDLQLCRNYIADLIIPSIEKYKDCFGYPPYIEDILTKNCNYSLEQLWVNFQKKYEFNPIHYHSGIFSFVIWIKNPYSEEELEVFNNIPKHRRENGCFSIFYTNEFGTIQKKKIFTDNSMENKGVLFPSIMNHSVNPFYSSDNYRISVSGNIKFKV